MDLTSIDDCLSDDAKLLNFLNLFTSLLNQTETGSLDIDKLCSQLENWDINVESSTESQISEDSIIIEQEDLKKILFADKDVIVGFDKAINALLNLLFIEINTAHIDLYKQLLNQAVQMSKLLKIFETHFNCPTIKNSVTEFLRSLIQILGVGGTPIIIEKASVRLLAAKIIEVFKEVQFARKFILQELNKKLKMFHRFMIKFTEINELYETCCFENLLLNLSVLKEILMYDVHELEVKPSKAKKTYDNVLKSIKSFLEEIIKMVPYFVQVLAQECLNLVI